MSGIDNPSLSFGILLKQFRQRATTWSLSFQRIQQANPATAELLHLCAFLAPDRIPEELIKDGRTYWPPLLRQTSSDPFGFNQMIEELLKFSLVKRLIETKTITIHRLVQAVQRDAIKQNKQRLWARRIIKAINATFPGDPRKISTWVKCQRYLEHVQECNEMIEQYALPLIEASDLLNE